MLQYRLDDDQGGTQPPKPPGWNDPKNPDKKEPTKETPEKPRK